MPNKHAQNKKMENINQINNYIPRNVSTQKANLVQISQQEPNQAQPQLSQNLQANTIQNQQINPSLMYDFQMAKMDNETVLKYLQNLLKLPNSIDKFINNLNNKNLNSKITSILVENLINTKALGEFLNQNSTQAISKLMQTISESLKSGINDIGQLKEMLSILGSIQNSTNLSSNALKELLLLYIPLNQPVFNEEINTGVLSKEETEAVKNSKLSIMFETLNFSNLMCCINESENNIFIDIFATKIFPNNHFATIINTLSKEININPYFDFKNIQEKDNKTNKQNFKIMTDSFVSSNILILSHLIIKTVYKIDNDFIE